MASIKPIEGSSVHRIQSGQVIVDLCSVVKELVENSLDAGASSIEVRFKNHGLDSIEVQDNGSGIAKDDYGSIGLKHYTSKLHSYEDLTALQTFGFRGEALSSLCALSDVHVLTAREDEAPKGARLEFDISGALKHVQIVAAQRGTTVAVENIFKNLPVRRQELVKNIKREYGKVVGLLQSYACISTEARLSVSNVVGKGKKTVVFATKSHQSTRDNIANVFGAKTLSALMPLDLDLELEARSGLLSAQETAGVHVLGHVSRPVVGEGRQLPDRQMFFVNGRPCGLPQFAKVMNEVYKTYNISQSPFIFANIILDTNAYDVNVSPDKRTILLHDQGPLLESVRASLVELFEKQQQTIPLSQIQRSIQKPSTYRTPAIHRSESTVSDTSVLDNSLPAVSAPQIQRWSPSSVVMNSKTVHETNAREDLLVQKLFKANVQERPASPGGSSKFPGPEDVPSPIEQMPPRKPTGRDQITSADIDDDHHGLVAPDLNKKKADVAVQDFNERLAEQQFLGTNVGGEISPDSAVAEARIFSVASTTKESTSGAVPNAFDRMRSIRTPSQKATITIGDKITTTTIGSCLNWKRPSESPLHQGKRHPKKPPASSNLTSSLRAFAAPCGRLGDVDSESEGEPKRTAHSVRATRQSTASSVIDVSQDDDDAEDPAGIGFEEREPANTVNELSDHTEEEGSDGEYLDDETKKAKEDAKVARLIAKAEEQAAHPLEEHIKRAHQLLKGAHRESTTKLLQTVETSMESIVQQLRTLEAAQQEFCQLRTESQEEDVGLAETAEERLSLTVSKTDFEIMQIIGQFNLGFIIAKRISSSVSSSKQDLFIIDQHASDEKYTFERLQATTTIQDQRLVHPQSLELTAVEEETIIEHQSTLVKNGFIVEVDESGISPVGQRCKLVSLPMSREVTFSARDLEELVAMLVEYPPAPQPSPPTTSILDNRTPRPSKIRRMFAMRACRSSVMIGKTLNVRQMEQLVRNMGMIDKPWNCPHGRPTMRHLVGLDQFATWHEDEGIAGLEEGAIPEADWTSWLEEEGQKGMLEGDTKAVDDTADEDQVVQYLPDGDLDEDADYEEQ